MVAEHLELVGLDPAVRDLHPHHLVVAALALAVDALVQAEDPEDVLVDLAREVLRDAVFEVGRARRSISGSRGRALQLGRRRWPWRHLQGRRSTDRRMRRAASGRDAGVASARSGPRRSDTSRRAPRAGCDPSRCWGRRGPGSRAVQCTEFRRPNTSARSGISTSVRSPGCGYGRYRRAPSVRLGSLGAMRMSQLFLRTLRDDPADAEVDSHRLLVRGGLHPPGRDRHLLLAAARPPGAAQGRADRARGDGRGRRAGDCRCRSSSRSSSGSAAAATPPYGPLMFRLAGPQGDRRSASRPRPRRS